MFRHAQASDFVTNFLLLVFLVSAEPNTKVPAGHHFFQQDFTHRV